MSLASRCWSAPTVWSQQIWSGDGSTVACEGAIRYIPKPHRRLAWTILATAGLLSIVLLMSGSSAVTFRQASLSGISP